MKLMTPRNAFSHIYFKREQRAYINNLRLLFNDMSYATLQINIVENYSLTRQRGIQAAHWNNLQETSFTIHMKVGSNHKNMVVIDDYMHHDIAFVYCAQRIIVKFVKKHYPQKLRK